MRTTRPTTSRRNSITLAAGLVLSLTPLAMAQEERPETATESAMEEVQRVTREVSPFGSEGSTYWSISLEGAYAADGGNVGPRVSVHHFLAEDFEISASLGVWGHIQDGNNAFSLNPSIAFRYHFVNKTSHSMYAELGVGLLFSNDEVPEMGTRTNFTPRAGLGVTMPVGDEGARLDFGLRWHHISNASTSGIDDNPDRDGIGVYAGIMIPF